MRGRDITTGRFSDNGTTPLDPLREKLDKLSLRLVEQMLGEAAEPAPLTGDDVALYKAVSNYYTATRRLPVTKPDEDEGEGFGELKARINGHAGADEA